jgi:tRNA pseudouridine32 synthase/23S rRNA pseudouridine746 synthase
MVRSRVYLPKLQSPPATVLEHLALRFPQIPASTWRDRMARGLVTTTDGTILTEDSPYQYGKTVFYLKEVPFEPPPVETETILYQDDKILAADKPHGMTVTPAGDYVARSLLNRLQERTGIDSLVPLHRLDRDTAGVVLFGIHADMRGQYHELFSKGTIEREYLAVAAMTKSANTRRWTVENRLVEGTPWFRQQITRPGQINAVTEIELIDTREGLGLFRLLPRTGKKHQLRVHMAYIGFPILGDTIYPEICQPEGSSQPLQLLAWRLTFADPLTGEQRDLRSTRRLASFPS